MIADKIQSWQFLVALAPFLGVGVFGWMSRTQIKLVKERADELATQLRDVRSELAEVKAENKVLRAEFAESMGTHVAATVMHELRPYLNRGSQ